MQLQDFAQVVRSKNAGPRRFTPLPIDYEQCCSDQLNPQRKAATVTPISQSRTARSWPRTRRTQGHGVSDLEGQI
jgi:hypothetical protein